jgi:hypothetical protein
MKNIIAVILGLFITAATFGQPPIRLDSGTCVDADKDGTCEVGSNGSAVTVDYDDSGAADITFSLVSSRPTITFNGNSGRIYENGGEVFSLDTAATLFFASDFRSNNSDGGSIVQNNSQSLVQPVFRLTGDTNTGLAFNRADDLALVTGGSQSYTISNDATSVSHTMKGLVTQAANVFDVLYDGTNSSFIVQADGDVLTGAIPSFSSGFHLLLGNGASTSGAASAFPNLCFGEGCSAGDASSDGEIVGIGYNVHCHSSGNVCIGSGAGTQAGITNQAIAIGDDANVGDYGTSVGSQSNADTASSATALGSGAKEQQGFGVSLGRNAITDQARQVAFWDIQQLVIEGTNFDANEYRLNFPDPDTASDVTHTLPDTTGEIAMIVEDGTNRSLTIDGAATQAANTFSVVNASSQATVYVEADGDLVSTGNDNVGTHLGSAADGTGTFAVGIGNSTTTNGANTTAIGDSAIASATDCTAVGFSSNCSASYSISIGSGSTNNVANSVVFGGNGEPITRVIIGEGTGDTAPPTVYIQPTSAQSISNKAGAPIVLQGGVSTGTGTGGDVIFYGSQSGISGSSQNSGTELSRIDAETANYISQGDLVLDKGTYTHTITSDALATTNRSFALPDDVLADHDVVMGDGAGSAAYAAIPDCHTDNMLTYTRSTNTWGCDVDDGAGGGMTSFDIDGDNNSPQTITNGNEALFVGGVNITTTAAVTDQVTFDLDLSATTNNAVLYDDGTDLKGVERLGCHHPPVRCGLHQRQQRWPASTPDHCCSRFRHRSRDASHRPRTGHDCERCCWIRCGWGQAFRHRHQRNRGVG